MLCGLVVTTLLVIGAVLISIGPRHDAETIADARKSGVLTAENVNIAFEGVTAKLAQRPVKESDLVKKGDVLMVLEDINNNLSIASVNAQIQQNVAQLESAKANWLLSQKEYQRASSYHKTPAGGAAFMIFIVPPGFIMGGTTFAVAMLPTWTYYFSYLFPLTWIFRIFRDVALRAESFYSMSATLGCHLIYVTILAILVTVRFFRTREKMTQEALSLVQ